MIKEKTYKPILAITMGDPAGIGPEIAAKALVQNQVLSRCRPVLVGNSEVFHKAMQFSGVKAKIHTIHNIDQLNIEKDTINVLEIEGNAIENLRLGKVSVQAGDIAFRSVQKAIELALSGNVDGTVTGPINKDAINRAGHKFSGHTEIYAHFTKTKDYAMLLADDHLRVIHVTTHLALSEACALIKKDRVEKVIEILNNGLKKLGISNPRIGVAGLNPHSGDGGLFGHEDKLEIAPAVARAREKGIDVEGPIPADTLFPLALGGKYDGCVAMYHDQGHIPFKLLGFIWDNKNKVMKSVKGVNITLGLPIIRTSVDHGTAFEIAGRGVASPEALLNAIDYALKLVNK